MPQLDPSVFSPQIIWLLVSFLILYLVLSFKGLPLIGRMLEQRQDTIEGDLDSAEKMRAQSVGLEAAYEEALANAKAEAASGMRKEREKLGKRLEAKKAGVDEKLSRKIAAAEATIRQAQDEAMVELEDIAAGACQAIVAKLSGDKVDAASARSAVQAQIKSVMG